jgi:hypothetical protein
MTAIGAAKCVAHILYTVHASWGYYTDYYTCVIVKEIGDFQSKLTLLATEIAT